MTPTQDEIDQKIAEAKIKYPVGTIVNSLGGSHNVKVEDQYYFNNVHYIRSHEDCALYSFNDDRWAQIVSYPNGHRLPIKWCLDIDMLTEIERRIARTYWEGLPNVDSSMSFKGYLLCEDASADNSYMNWGSADEYEKITFAVFKNYMIDNKVHAVIPPDETVVNQFPIY